MVSSQESSTKLKGRSMETAEKNKGSARKFSVLRYKEEIF